MITNQPTTTMETTSIYTYRIKFNNGQNFICKAENLTNCEKKVVNHIEKNNLYSCEILTPGGFKVLVKKTGAWHHTHNGYMFTR